MSLFDDFFGTNEKSSGGIFDSIFGGSGSTSGSNSREHKPLFGSGGTYDDQKKPAGSQHIVYGSPCSNEKEVKDAINASSYWGSLGGTCKYCSCYLPNKASLLDHEATCIYRK